MIYCNLSDSKFEYGIKIEGNGLHIRDELAVILIELNKTPAGIYLLLDALEQSEDPDRQDYYDSEIRAFSGSRQEE